jgi:hypothetical protein
MCARVVSPGIVAQLTPLLPPPVASQRSQRYRNDATVPDQLPFEVRSVLPSVVVPEIRGWPVGFGAACERAEPPAGISDATTIATTDAAPSA